jgi:hypothetical protein
MTGLAPHHMTERTAIPFGGCGEQPSRRRYRNLQIPAGVSAMSHYEIHYTMMGEPHTDVINSLDVPVVDVVVDLARKNNIAVNDDLLVDPAVLAISDVSIHDLDAVE